MVNTGNKEHLENKFLSKFMKSDSLKLNMAVSCIPYRENIQTTAMNEAIKMDGDEPAAR